MASLLLTATTKRSRLSLITKPQDERASAEKRRGIFGSREPLFGGQHDDWEDQVLSTAGGLRPGDDNFPWFRLSKHTDAYLAKKGKMRELEVDRKLEVLIWSQEKRDIAIAACGYAMSPMSLMALLKVELNVTPATYHGLEMYLHSLIAANHCNPQAVSDLEARWARNILPFATTGTGAAGKFMEGAAHALWATETRDLRALPHLSKLIQNALEVFSTHLRGYLLQCRWVSAHAATAWMAPLLESTSTMKITGRLLPEDLLDSQLPFWRAWASWRPDMMRIASFDGIIEGRRGVLPDLLALEGPDILTRRCSSLRDGLVSMYGENKPVIRFRGLEFEVPSCSKDEFKNLMVQLGTALENSLHSPPGIFDTFVKIFIATPIAEDTFRVMDAIRQTPDTVSHRFPTSVATIWSGKDQPGRKHMLDNQRILEVLNTVDGKPLRHFLVQPWLTKEVENCFQDLQSALSSVLMHNEYSDPEWATGTKNFVEFCEVLRNSVDILGLQLSPKVLERLNMVPTTTFMQTLLYELYERQDIIYKKYANRPGARNMLKIDITAYCESRLATGKLISSTCHRTIEGLVEFWIQNKSPERRDLAVITSLFTDGDTELLLRCLEQIPPLSDSHVNEIFDTISTFQHDETRSCIFLTEYLAKMSSSAEVQSWKDVLLKMLLLEGYDHTNYVLEFNGVEKWLTWVLELSRLFADVIENPKASPPLILRRTTILRAKKLCEYLPALTRFEKALPPMDWTFAATGSKLKAGKSPLVALQCLVEGSYPPATTCFPDILDCLRLAMGTPKEPVLHQILRELSTDDTKNRQVAESASALHWASEVGVKACEQITESANKPSLSKGALEVIVSGWLDCERVEALSDGEEPGVTDGHEQILLKDELGIKKIAELYNITIYNGLFPEGVIEEVAAYYDDIEEEILQEVIRLEMIKNAMHIRDAVSTSTFLKQLGYPQFSVLDQHLSQLPVEIIDAFEKRSEDTVEISFPLSSFTALQRAAMSVGEANTLILQLHGFKDIGLPSSFCVHLDTDLDLLDPRQIHTPFICHTNCWGPKKPYCKGTPSALTLQISRYLCNQLKLWRPSSGNLATLYSMVKDRVDNYAYSCMLCHTALPVTDDPKIYLRRPLPCTPCAKKTWKYVPLAIKIPEIRTDPFLVDMLLTSLYAAAVADRLDLLPTPYIPFNSIDMLHILSTLPSTSALQTADDPSALLKDCHKYAEELVLYACTYYRGLLASASGITKIHGLHPGTHQFVLANAKFCLESRFQARVPKTATGGNPPTRVLFHGTSFDRLPGILGNGLLNCSHTPLQRSGAAYGKGIYLAENPSTSFGYAPAAISWKNSGLSNMQVVLGCEVVGADHPASGDIHVIKDEHAVMVRYIFLFPRDAHAPYANHITTPMMSTMRALRSGAL